MTAWLDPQEVADLLGDAALGTSDRLGWAVDAAMAQVEDWRGDLVAPDGTFTPTPDVIQGARQYAATVYRATDTYGPGTIAGMDLSALGVAIVDPMTERLLGVGRFRRGGRVG